MWMNDYEIDTACLRYSGDTERPNLARAVLVLSQLRDWTDCNSDGWPYWRKPANAAKSLMLLLNDVENSGMTDDVRLEDVNKTFRPIKAFLTRQGVEHSKVFPV